MRKIGDIREVDLINHFVKNLKQGKDVIIGPGDDAAVTALHDNDRELVLTSDPVISGIHYEHGTAGEHVGYKAVCRVLSDLAAMGALPHWILINLVAPADTDERFINALSRGAAKAAEAHAVSIVGGDVACQSPLQLHVFGVGSIKKGQAVKRSGAASGERIFVTGSLGGSLAGHHLTFTPRIQEGIWLAKAGATAMIDITDGMATDLRHLCDASQTGAEVFAAYLPISPHVVSAAKTPQIAINHALCDGEDYELLFTFPEDKSEALIKNWNNAFSIPCTAIGRIVPLRDGISLLGTTGCRKPMLQKGYSHFA